jgi:hypothetical protein
MPFIGAKSDGVYIIMAKFGLINLGGVEVKPPKAKNDGLEKKGQTNDYGRTTGKTGEGADAWKKI